MRRFVAMSLLSALVFSAFPASSALAQGAAKTASSSTKKPAAEKRWPMSADRFRAEIEARIGKKRARMERSIEKRKMNSQKAVALRQGFLNDVGQVRSKLAAVTADGVVTREEADQVRGRLRQIRAHR